jgi:predicted CoA-binding protein
VILTTPSQRNALQVRSKSVVVVGASQNPMRPSYTVFSYLRTRTHFAVIPINPTIEAIDGVKAYPSLSAYAASNGPPDIVDIFRKPSELVPIIQEAIAVGAKAIWLQYGVIDADAITLADVAGLDVVVDRCMKVEHGRFHGGLAATGIDTGLITSRRHLE